MWSGNVDLTRYKMLFFIFGSTIYSISNKKTAYCILLNLCYQTISSVEILAIAIRNTIFYGLTLFYEILVDFEC